MRNNSNINTEANGKASLVCLLVWLAMTELPLMMIRRLSSEVA